MDYIYLQDDCADRHTCSRCGQPVFTDMSRREPHEVWIERINAHKECEPVHEEVDNES